MNRRRFLGLAAKSASFLAIFPTLLSGRKEDEPVLMGFKGKCDIEPGYVISPYVPGHYAWEQTRVSELRVGDVFRFLDDPCRVIGNPMEVESIWHPFSARHHHAADRLVIACVDGGAALVFEADEWVIVRRVKLGYGPVKLLTSREDVEMSGKYSQVYNAKTVNSKFYKRIKLK